MELPAVRQVKREVSYRVDNFTKNVGHRGRSEPSCHGGFGTIDFTVTRTTCRQEQSLLSQHNGHSIQDKDC
jgi:hypothetical protein